MIGTLGNHIQTFSTGYVQDIGLFNAIGDLLGARHDIFTVGRQRFGFLLLAQQLAQLAVGVASRASMGGDMHKGDAGLLSQRIQIFLHGLLGFAHVDDHIGRGGQQRFQVHFALAAVQLTQQGQVVIRGGQDALGALIPGVGNAHQHFWRKGKDEYLRQRAGNGDPGDVGGQRYLASRGIHERAHSLRRGEGAQAARQAQRKQQGQELFHHEGFLLDGLVQPFIFLSVFHRYRLFTFSVISARFRCIGSSNGNAGSSVSRRRFLR